MTFGGATRRRGCSRHEPQPGRRHPGLAWQATLSAATSPGRLAATAASPLCAAGATASGCATTIWIAPSAGLTATAPGPSLSAACCRSSGPSSHCRPGSREWPPVRFGIYTIIGCIPWTVALAAVGYAVGANWQAVVNGFHGPTYVIAALGVVRLRDRGLALRSAAQGRTPRGRTPTFRDGTGGGPGVAGGRPTGKVRGIEPTPADREGRHRK